MLNLLLFQFATLLAIGGSDPIYISGGEDITSQLYVSKECVNSVDLGEHAKSRVCGRAVVDGAFSSLDIAKLRETVEKGMSERKAIGGPTILDLNTGFIRDSTGVENLFARDNDIYTAEEFAHYGTIIERLRQSIVDTFNMTSGELFFTAPTFFTRIDMSKNWQPQEMHDEYWHVHADMTNTNHYHYSGLLYMSTYGEDFSGGRLSFVKGDGDNSEQCSSDQCAEARLGDENAEMIVEPKPGRLVIFSSGEENPHRVEPVLSGQRFVLSFWFTTDVARKFEIYLDGRAHTRFSHSMRERLKAKRES